MGERPTKEQIEEDAMKLAALLLDIYKNPTENGIIVNGQNETDDGEDIN